MFVLYSLLYFIVQTGVLVPPVLGLILFIQFIQFMRIQFSERKNCSEHDYPISRMIERFPGSEMTKKHLSCAFFGYFLDFSPG